MHKYSGEPSLHIFLYTSVYIGSAYVSIYVSVCLFALRLLLFPFRAFASVYSNFFALNYAMELPAAGLVIVVVADVSLW